MSGARIDITAVDKASPVVKSVQGTFQNLAKEAKSSILTGVGLGAGVTAFGLVQNAVTAAAGALGDMVKNAISDEESVNRLGASLKANVAGFDGNTAAIEKWITAQQRLGFDDEQLRDSLTVLTGATHDVGKAQEIAATAMDLARFKGIDLRTASEALIKVEGGHYRSLAQLGIKLRDGATSTEALAAVQKVAGGQAEAFGDTTAGAMQEASIAISEAGETLGKALLPVIKETAIWARDDLAPALQSVADNAGKLGPVFDWWRAALGDQRQLTQELAEQYGQATAAGDAYAANMAGIRAAWAESAAGLAALAPKMGSAAQTFYQPLYGEAAAARRKAAAEIRALPGDLAKALRQGHEDVKSGMADLTEQMETSLSDAAKAAYLKGVLSSKELARGLTDERADVRAAALQVKADAQEQLDLLESGAADAAVNAGTTFAEQLRLQKEAAGQAAADVKRGVTGNLEFTDDAKTKGSTGIGGFTSGITANWTAAQTAAISIRNAVRSGLAFDAWPGGYSIGSTWVNAMIAAMKAKQSAFLGEAYWYKNIYGGSLPTAGPLQHPESGGKSIAEAWLGGMVSSLASGRGDVTAAFPSLGGGGGGAMTGGGYGMGGGVTIQLQVDGRVLAEVVDRNLVYMTPKTGILGRG